MIRQRLLILTALLFISPLLVLAQQSKPADDKTAEKALKAKAYELLDSLATQIGTLQSAENRARFGSNIAASIWSHDEKRARALFVAVGEDIKLGLQQRENPNRFTEQNSTMVFMHLRENTVDRIAKLDPEFAFDFLISTEPTLENPPYDVDDKNKSIAVRLAKQIAASNPELSLKVGRRALAQGFSEDLLSLLRQLLRKNSQHGMTLYKETVQKLRSQKFKPNLEEPREDWQLFTFAFALADIQPPLVEELAYKEFMNILIAAADANKCDKADPEGNISYFCSQIGVLVSKMEKVDPRRAAKFKHLQSEDEERAWGPDVYNELNDLVEAQDYDGIFELAKTYPGLKDTMYWRALQMAQKSGDLERARKIANDYTDDPEVQQRMLAQLEPAKEEPAIDDAKLDEIQKEAEKITNVNERMAFLVESSIRIGEKNRNAALKMYDQINERMQEFKGGDRIQGQAFVAMLYCMEKSDRGFALMESLMPKLNEVIDSAAKLDGFDTNYMRDGEWNMSANGSLGRFLTELSQNSGYFAWCDFDRAVNLAAQFERTEIRMMAQLKLAQAILSGPPQRYSFRRY